MRFSYLGLSEPVNLINDALFSYIRSYRHKEPMLGPLTPSGVYATDYGEAARFASKNEMATYTSILPFLKSTDLIFCFLPDAALKGLASDLRGHGIRKKIFCHFSPSFSADILDFGEENTYISFFVPTCKKLERGKLSPSNLFVEGYGERYSEVLNVCRILGIKFHEIAKNDKLLYIAAVSMLTEFQNYITRTSEKLLKISLYDDYSLYEDILGKINSDEYVINGYDPTDNPDIRFIDEQRSLFKSIGLDDVSTLYASLLLAKTQSREDELVLSQRIKEIALKIINK